MILIYILILKQTYISNRTKQTDVLTHHSGATLFNSDITSWDTENVLSMRDQFHGATSFNKDLSTWTISQVTNLLRMFKDASNFNVNLCSWEDTFPSYNDNWAFDIFEGSGCTYQDTPRGDRKGPFCASDCGRSPTVRFCFVNICCVRASAKIS